MIIDRLEHASLYLAVHPGVAAAFEYLRKTDLDRVEPGNHEIDGRRMYVMAQRYETKAREKGRCEAHRRYIDVQYVHRGVELFGYANLAELKPGSYDEAKDFLSLEGEGKGDFFRVGQGMFVILFPQDGHMPGLAILAPQPVRKFVVKVALEG